MSKMSFLWVCFVIVFGVEGFLQKPTECFLGGARVSGGVFRMCSVGVVYEARK